MINKKKYYFHQNCFIYQHESVLTFLIVKFLEKKFDLSLIVSAYRIIENKIYYIDDSPEYPHNDLFGTEDTRNTIWSSKYLIELGCKLLPKLKSEDLYCDGLELEILKIELHLILSNMDILNQKLELQNDYLLFRVKNALAAVEIAKKHKNGGVYIG